MKDNIWMIADSGSTKTDWVLIKNKQCVKKITTKGINPYFQSPQHIQQEIQQQLIPLLPTISLKHIYYYGAGCTPQKAPIIKSILQQALPFVENIEVQSDLLAAARALCGNKEGIACILGTGSNSCYYNGTNIAQQVPALGFILGDEGGGDYLGKCLVSDILKNQLGKQLQQKFFKQFNTNMADIIENVYNQPFPNRYLAQFNVFLEQNKAQQPIHNLLVNAFTLFISRNIMQYPYKTLPLNCIGSIAVIYQEELTLAAKALGVMVGKVCKSPMPGLIAYHTT